MDLRGKIVTLRGIERNDMEFLQEMLNDPDINLTLLNSHFPVSIETQNNWYDNWDQKSELRYIVENKQTNKRIGLVMLTNINWFSRTAEIALKSVYNKDVREKGDMKEALELLLQYAFEEMNMHMLEAKIIDFNFMSVKFADEVGLKKEAVLKDRIFKKGKYRDLMIYSIFQDQYRNSKKNKS